MIPRKGHHSSACLLPPKRALLRRLLRSVGDGSAVPFGRLASHTLLCLRRHQSSSSPHGSSFEFTASSSAGAAYNDFSFPRPLPHVHTGADCAVCAGYRAHLSVAHAELFRSEQKKGGGGIEKGGSAPHSDGDDMNGRSAALYDNSIMNSHWRKSQGNEPQSVVSSSPNPSIIAADNTHATATVGTPLHICTPTASPQASSSHTAARTHTTDREALLAASVDAAIEAFLLEEEEGMAALRQMAPADDDRCGVADTVGTPSPHLPSVSAGSFPLPFSSAPPTASRIASTPLSLSAPAAADDDEPSETVEDIIARYLEAYKVGDEHRMTLMMRAEALQGATCMMGRSVAVGSPSSSHLASTEGTTSSLREEAGPLRDEADVNDDDAEQCCPLTAFSASTSFFAVRPHVFAFADWLAGGPPPAAPHSRSGDDSYCSDSPSTAIFTKTSAIQFISHNGVWGFGTSGGGGEGRYAPRRQPSAVLGSIGLFDGPLQDGRPHNFAVVKSPNSSDEGIGAGLRRRFQRKGRGTFSFAQAATSSAALLPSSASLGQGGWSVGPYAHHYPPSTTSFASSLGTYTYGPFSTGSGSSEAALHYVGSSGSSGDALLDRMHSAHSHYRHCGHPSVSAAAASPADKEAAISAAFDVSAARLFCSADASDAQALGLQKTSPPSWSSKGNEGAPSNHGDRSSNGTAADVPTTSPSPHYTLSPCPMPSALTHRFPFAARRYRERLLQHSVHSVTALMAFPVAGWAGSGRYGRALRSLPAQSAMPMLLSASSSSLGARRGTVREDSPQLGAGVLGVASGAAISPIAALLRLVADAAAPLGLGWSLDWCSAEGGEGSGPFVPRIAISVVHRSPSFSSPPTSPSALNNGGEGRAYSVSAHWPADDSPSFAHTTTSTAVYGHEMEWDAVEDYDEAANEPFGDPTINNDSPLPTSAPSPQVVGQLIATLTAPIHTAPYLSIHVHGRCRVVCERIEGMISNEGAAGGCAFVAPSPHPAPATQRRSAIASPSQAPMRKRLLWQLLR